MICFCKLIKSSINKILSLELDLIFGEIESSIIQEEIQIMIKLTELITHKWISDLHSILKLIAELDWYVYNLYII